MCVDLNSQPKCNCFKNYSGNDYEIKCQDLKLIVTSVKSTTIVAIITLSLFYLFFPLNDLFNKYY